MYKNIDKLIKHLKTQKEIYDYTGKGICFLVAMYNIFPYVFDSKEDFETVCKDFDERDRNLTECVDYFNKRLILNNVDEQFITEDFSTNNHSFTSFLSYLHEHANNLMIIMLSSKLYPEQGHAIAYFGLENDNMVYFENQNDAVIFMCTQNLIKRYPNIPNKYKIYFKHLSDNLGKNIVTFNELKESLASQIIVKQGRRFSMIDPELLYFSCDSLIFIYPSKNNKFICNCSERFSSLNLPLVYLNTDECLRHIDENMSVVIQD